MSTVASQTQTEVVRPEGFTDEAYDHLVQLIVFAREIEALGGSAGIISLLTEKPPAADFATFAVATAVDLSWVNGTGFTANVWSDGWFKKNVHVDITTDDGHRAKINFTSALGWMIPGTQTLTGTLGFNEWSALKAGANDIVISTSGKAPITVNGSTQGEFTANVPPHLPSFSYNASFTWDS